MKFNDLYETLMEAELNPMLRNHVKKYLTSINMIKAAKILGGGITPEKARKTIENNINDLPASIIQKLHDLIDRDLLQKEIEKALKTIVVRMDQVRIAPRKTPKTKEEKEAYRMYSEFTKTAKPISKELNSINDVLENDETLSPTKFKYLRKHALDLVHRLQELAAEQTKYKKNLDKLWIKIPDEDN